jgi:hypothetical protein
MKEIVSLSTNFSAVIEKEGKPKPNAEVILILSEPVYRFTSSQEIIKERELTTVRFAANPTALRLAAKTLTEFAVECEDWLGDSLEWVRRDERERITKANLARATAHPGSVVPAPLSP